jgi:hypothetical protein
MYARYIQAKCELEAERYVVDSSKGLIHAYTHDMNRKIVAQLEGVINKLTCSRRLTLPTQSETTSGKPKRRVLGHP